MCLCLSLLIACAEPLPEGVRAIAEAGGSVVDLPLEINDLDNISPGLGEGWNRRWVDLARVHGQPLLHGPEPIESSPLLAEPVVVLALNAAAGEARWAVPGANPGQVLMDLQVRRLVVHREHFSVEALAVVDAILHKAFDPPQRDLVGEIDLYSLPVRVGREVAEQRLHELSAEGLPEGWYSQEGYLEAWR